MQSRPANLETRFAHIDTWVFDLDNTLYPQTADLWPKIDERITLFMMRLFGLDAISLARLAETLLSALRHDACAD